MARRPPKNAIAVGEGKIPEERLLGRLATCTNPDEEVSGAKFVRSWDAHGLDVDELPEARQPVHVFQSACSSVKQKRGTNGHGERVEVRADEIENAPTTCSYQITRAVWDVANRVIEHEQAMRVTFDKRTSAITIDKGRDYDPKLAGLGADIQRHFNANAKTVPGQKVRNAVRAQILKLGGQNLRRKAGGLYFVPIEYIVKHANGREAVMAPTLPTLQGLKGVLADLYGDRGDFYTIPLANDDEERAMVAKHFAINTNDRARELAEKAINRVRSGKGERGIRADMVANLFNERRKLMGSVAQFEELVTVEQKDLAANLRALDDALNELQELADTD